MTDYVIVHPKAKPGRRGTALGRIHRADCGYVRPTSTTTALSPGDRLWPLLWSPFNACACTHATRGEQGTS